MPVVIRDGVEDQNVDSPSLILQLLFTHNIKKFVGLASARTTVIARAEHPDSKPLPTTGLPQTIEGDTAILCSLLLVHRSHRLKKTKKTYFF